MKRFPKSVSKIVHYICSDHINMKISTERTKQKQRLAEPPKKLSKKALSLSRLENFKKEVITDLHQIPLEELIQRLDTHKVRGLTVERARLLLERDGPNTLTPSRRIAEYKKFLRTITHGFSLLLWMGVLLCILSYVIKTSTGFFDNWDDLILAGVLTAVVLITGVFMYVQEHKSHKIMEMFENMIPPKAVVIRGGVTMSVVSRELVVGDLVELKFGDRVPADVRIIASHGFKVDNSALTGESEPIWRTTEATSNVLLDTKNVAFFSTNAVEGTAQGIVFACGDNTIMGRIAGLTARLKPGKTPIARELSLFMRNISLWACFLGTSVGIASILRGYSIIEASLFLIGVIVANVPEGLLATVTVSLSIAAKKMAAKNCVMKSLEAVETLGSTSVICSDKTGTLTQNRMTVFHLWFDMRPLDASKVFHAGQNSLKSLLRCAVLCNRAEFETFGQPINDRKVRGDASEVALLKYVEEVKIFGKTDLYRRRNFKIIEVPFNSSTKYQYSVHALENNKCAVLMKGAPERIMDQCTHILVDNETIELTEEIVKVMEAACTNLALKGERVLGFCDLKLSETFTRSYPFQVEPKPNFPHKGFRFLGFISLIDPPRPQVLEAVNKCRSAGIKVIMITGDHPVTAATIAKEVGIFTSDCLHNWADLEFPLNYEKNGNKSIVIPGSFLRELANDELDTILQHYNEIVFARTSPTQKLHIVEGYQRIGHIVAVTGDGVNDSPALKKADIGIAMGTCGSEVSQQSSDMILLDDNFASIITGIEEGRKIFDNLKKSIVYTLASNVAEITPLLGFLILNIPLPIGVIAILCIDLLTDMFPAISLAYENAESDIMQRPPRNRDKDHLVTGKLVFLAYGYIGMIESFAGYFVYFMIMAEHGFFPEDLIGIRERWESEKPLVDSRGHFWSKSERKRLEYTCYTGYMVSVVVTQIADVIVCKTRRNSIFHQGMKNWALNFSLISEILVACALTYTPGIHYLKFHPLQFRWWTYAIPFSIILFTFDELRKWHIRNYPFGFWKRESYY